MRIFKVRVSWWRNFENVDMDVSTDMGIVCLIGENGTGKSNILELIAAAAHQFGVSPGLEIPRGNPLEDPHDIEISMSCSLKAQDLFTDQELERSDEESWVGSISRWDNTLHLVSNRKDATAEIVTRVYAGGVDDSNGRASQLGKNIVQRMRKRYETHYLSLDADRSYPKVQINPNQWAEAVSTDWEQPQHKKQKAYKPTRDLYEEWIRYFLARESQTATEHTAATRRARRADQDAPQLHDPFAQYEKAVNTVLPHLRFDGVDTRGRNILFDSAGQSLSFGSLSGGEREITFVLGQIERFQLRQGLLLIDEPELHLNPDLVRRWVAYLRDTIETGQVWISTHSMEAAEVAGSSSTFILQRQSESRIVDMVRSVANEPVLQLLSAAVGSPAFSIEDRTFVFIEGERFRQERERFYRMLGQSADRRFMEGGGCRQVLGKLDTVKSLSEEMDQALHVGAIVDRDFRSESEVEELERRGDTLVLGCHEVENVFLYPAALDEIARTNGLEKGAKEILIEAADELAGRWILARVQFKLSAPDHPPSRAIRDVCGRTEWEVILDSEEGFRRRLQVADEEFCGLDGFDSELRNAIAEYQRVREREDLWKYVMGKEIFRRLAGPFGFKNPDVFEKNVVRSWTAGWELKPEEVGRIERFVAQL